MFSNRSDMPLTAVPVSQVEQALQEFGVGDIFPDWPARPRRDAIRRTFAMFERTAATE